MRGGGLMAGKWGRIGDREAVGLTTMVNGASGQVASYRLHDVVGRGKGDASVRIISHTFATPLHRRPCYTDSSKRS